MMNALSAKIALERKGYAIVEHPLELRVHVGRVLVDKLPKSPDQSVDRGSVELLVLNAADYLGKGKT